jgi:hypothetical protein
LCLFVFPTYFGFFFFFLLAWNVYKVNDTFFYLERPHMQLDAQIESSSIEISNNSNENLGKYENDSLLFFFVFLLFKKLKIERFNVDMLDMSNIPTERKRVFLFLFFFFFFFF